MKRPEKAQVSRLGQPQNEPQLDTSSRIERNQFQIIFDGSSSPTARSLRSAIAASLSATVIAQMICIFVLLIYVS